MTDISPRTPCSDPSALQRVPLIGTKATADFHQGAQRSCSKSDAVYMAAAEITPASPEKPLPRRSHPYMCIGQEIGPPDQFLLLLTPIVMPPAVPGEGPARTSPGSW